MMTKREASFRNSISPLAAAALLLALGGCQKTGGEQEADQLDNALVESADDTDPALTSALEDQIMVDPALAQQSGATSARPTAGPLQAPIPRDLAKGSGATAQQGLLRTPAPTPGTAGANPTLGEIAKLQASTPAGRKNQNCLKGLKYSASWAQKVPADIPLYPQAQVSEAAGNDDNGCSIRIVSFATGAALQPVLDWYYTRAVRSGYSAEHAVSQGDHILAGTKGDAAYYLMARAKQGGGSEVDLVVSQPR